jgi:RNA polymerase-associated protein
MKRSIITLYSDASDVYSHMVRMVLAEKAVAADIIHIDPNEPPSELMEVNPYVTVPTLLDRDLILYEPSIILEYLDERYPHPPLLPGYPTERAKSRLMINRIEKDWLSAIKILESGDGHENEKVRKDLRDHLIGIAPLFSEKPYFFGEEFSLVDCCIGTFLWRLPKLGIELPRQANAIKEYAMRIFDRPAFQASLSTAEREMKLEKK